MTVPAIALNDGTSIPQIGFGVWQVPEDVVVDATLEAFAAGYRHVDTAAVYQNEAGVGEAIRRSDLDRADMYITTKCWNADQGYDEALRAFDTSMAKLGIEQVDLYLIHWQCLEVGKYLDTWKALIALKESGRARSIGVSNFHEKALRHIIDETGVVPVLNQLELQPWLPQTRMRDVNASLNIATESWSPLASGELLGDQLIADIASKHSKSPAQVMIRWHIQLGNIVLPKSVTPARIRENIDVFDFALDVDDVAVIATLESGRRTGPHPDEFNYVGW